MIEPEKVRGAELVEALPKLLKGAFPGVTGDEDGEPASAWLRWVQSNSNDARVQWAFVAEAAKKRRDLDRDRFVLDLWHSMDAEVGMNSKGRKFIEVTCPWSYYQRHFFGWFLSRFDIASAASIYDRKDLLLRCQALLLLFALGLAVAYFLVSRALHRIEVVGGLLTLAGILAAWWGVVLWAERKGFERWAFIQAATPRLGAAVGIGYLFLASASALVSLLYRSRLSAWIFAILLVAFFAAAFAYVMHHIERRVHPPLMPKERAVRALHVLLLAVTYALAGLPLAVPLFFSHGFLGLEEGVPLQVGWRHVALVAAIALNLGVILQLAWDEKPLTEPL